MSEPSVANKSFLDTLAQAAILIAAAALIGVVFVQGWQVIARYVLNDSPGWTEPMALLLLNIAMSFGAAAGVHRQSHFNFPLLLDAMPTPLRTFCIALRCLLIASIGAALAFFGMQIFLDGLDIRMAGTALPQTATYLPLALGGGLMVIFALAQLRISAPPAIDVGAE
jgi:TRAP-type C4-dicarboxylate transport system permease small subunit